MKTKKQRKAIKKQKLMNKKLVKEFPFLKPRNVWTGKYDKDYDYSYTWLMPGGWFKLQINLCRELKPLLLKANYLYEYQLFQVKEKFGFLRWYDSGVPNEIYDEYNNILYKYERLSEQTCIKCGKPAQMCDIGGWITPYCEKCMEKIHNNYNKFRKAPISFSYENYMLKEGDY